jgi:restriction system protein
MAGVPVMAVVNWLLAHWWVLVAADVLAVLTAGSWLYWKQQQALWKAVRAIELDVFRSQHDGDTCGVGSCEATVSS